MRKRPVIGRWILNVFIQIVSYAAAFIGIFFLAWILWVVLQKGISSFGVAFFTRTTLDGDSGGVLNAIVGTAMITVTATLLAVPVSMLGGIYLSEFGRSGKFGNVIRFSANVMMGMPSILIGLFVYGILVVTTGNFSGFSGSVALAIIMFPVVLRTTEDMLSMVPNELREAALALGTPRWKVTLQILFRSARRGLVTGILLAVARVSGETAPLLFTALSSFYWPTHPWWNLSTFFTSPTANLTVTINDYAVSPYPGMNAIAWGASFLITAGVLAVNIITRNLFREAKK